MVGPFTAMWYQGLQGTCLILVKFVPAVAYHLCLNLPATFSQPCTSHRGPFTNDVSSDGGRGYWVCGNRLVSYTIGSGLADRRRLIAGPLRRLLNL